MQLNHVQQPQQQILMTHIPNARITSKYAQILRIQHVQYSLIHAQLSQLERDVSISQQHVPQCQKINASRLQLEPYVCGTLRLPLKHAKTELVIMLLLLVHLLMIAKHISHNVLWTLLKDASLKFVRISLIPQTLVVRQNYLDAQLME